LHRRDPVFHLLGYPNVDDLKLVGPNVDDLKLVGPNVDDLMNYFVDAM